MKFLTMPLVLAALLLAPSLSLPSLSPSPLASSPVPPRAERFERALIGNVRFVWGLDAPIAVFAGQVEQESAWDPLAQSPYASGLAQFTPSTASDISKKYPDLAANQPFEPAWALRALARYDKDLYLRYSDAVDSCNQWGFTLSAYNGGAGWLERDRGLSGTPNRWFDGVELKSKRSKAAFKENRHYPRVILFTKQLHYTTWGSVVSCQEQ